MKLFTRLKKYSSSNLLNSSKSEENVRAEPDTLDYFSDQSALSKMITDGQRQMMRRMGKRVESLDSLEFETLLNDEFINDRALQKYHVRKDEFSLDNTEWFPRLRYHHKHEKHNPQASSDNISLDSYDSDFSHDGFAGPFSWESRSLQELEFPPTPDSERKFSPIPKQNKMRKMNSMDLTEESHCTYETIEELRERLKKNYIEAKKQREKYLNLSPNKPKSEDSNLNGYRSKTQKQPVFKNYKQKSDATPKINGVVKFSSDVANPGTFAAELSSALKKNNEKVSSSEKYSAPETKIPYSVSGSTSVIKPRSPSGHSTKSNQNPPFPPSVSSTSMSSHTETPKSNRKSPAASRTNSIKRSLSKCSDSFRKSPEIVRTDAENVVANENAVLANDEVSKTNVGVDVGTNESNEETALSNVMDMLANW